VHGEVQKVGRLFERIGAARDDDAGEAGLGGEQLVDAPGQAQPLVPPVATKRTRGASTAD